jgi:putative DNA primase/helicase
LESVISPKESAIEYVKIGYSVILLRNPEPPARWWNDESDDDYAKRRKQVLDGRKRPLSDWKNDPSKHNPHKQRLTILQIEQAYTFNPFLNLGVATGNISKLIAIDVDGESARKRLEDRLLSLSEELQAILAKTAVNKTGSGGMHILFRIEHETDISQMEIWANGEENHSQILVQGNNHYVVMPPSRHPNDKLYETNGKEPQTISKEQLDEFIQKVGLPELVRPKETGDYDYNESVALPESTRSLTEEQTQQLLQLVKPYYLPGSRNEIIFHLSGAMRREGITHQCTRDFVKLLCESSEYSDEDLYKSLDKVDNSYKSERVNGKSGLKEALFVGFGDEGKEDFFKMCQIFNAPNFLGEEESQKKVVADRTRETSAKEKVKENIVIALHRVGQGEQEQEQEEQKEQEPEQQIPPQQQEETSKEKKVRELTEILQSQYHFAAMEDTEELYFYSELHGRYKPAKVLVKSTLEKLYTGIMTDTVTNVYEKLARRHLVNREEFDKDIFIINMKNGLYDIRTDTLMPHTWQYLSLRQIPIKFDRKARSKLFGSKYLSTVVYPAQVRTLVEAMAYTLLRHNPFEIYVICVGFGSNGKSVLMHVLTRLHGEENVSRTPLTVLLRDRFSRKDLVGMNVNIDTEMSKATIDDMGILKELTGSEPIRVEEKYLPAYPARLWAKNWFSANKMPEIRDDTDAHFRREIVISFPYLFEEGKNANPNLKYELTIDEELSGIFNALVIPLRRIALENKPPYMDAKTIQDRRMKSQLIMDPVRAFKEYCIEPTDLANEPDITKEEVYKAYSQKFCPHYKLPVQKYQPFCEAFKKLGIDDSRGTANKDTNERKRVWLGIRLKKYMFEDILTV